MAGGSVGWARRAASAADAQRSYEREPIGETNGFVGGREPEGAGGVGVSRVVIGRRARPHDSAVGSAERYWG